MVRTFFCLVFTLFITATAAPNRLVAQTYGSNQANIPAGPYQIQPKLNQSACMDLNHSNSANGTAIQSYSCNGTNAQAWKLVPISGSSGAGYQLVSMTSGSCLDVSAISRSDGALVQQWQCVGANQSNQIWQLVPYGNLYEVVSLNSAKCLDLPNGDSSNGIRLQQWSCSAGQNNNQLWTLAPGLDLGEQAAQAQAFFDSMGVETKVSYLNSAFGTQWPAVFAKLKALGIHHLRDGYYNWSASSSVVTNHQLLAAAGFATTYVVPLEFSTTVSQLQSTFNNVRDMEALEGPNECDVNAPCGVPGIVGILNAAAFMPTLYAAGTTLNIPVIGPSFTTAEAYAAAGNIASRMNFNNLHVYFGGRNPGSIGWGGGDAQGNSYGSFAWWMDQGNTDGPGVPDVISESGYYNSANPSPYQLPEEIAASYIPRTYLLAFNHGVKRTFVHEFLDEDASPYFGLLRYDLSERPAFWALKNLTSLVSDPGTSFTPGKLHYAISGGDATLNHTLLQRRDGTFLLIAWLEQSSYDEIRNVATPVTPITVSLSLTSNESIKSILHFDSTGNVSSAALSGGASGTPITINDQLTVIQITAQ